MVLCVVFKTRSNLCDQDYIMFFFFYIYETDLFVNYLFIMIANDAPESVCAYTRMITANEDTFFDKALRFLNKINTNLLRT